MPKVRHILSPQPAYTTVATFLKILEAKGYVEHRRREMVGRTFCFYPQLSRQKYLTQVVGDVRDTLFGRSAKKSHAWSAAKSALLLPLTAFTLMAFAKPTYYICTPGDADKDSQTEKHIIPPVEGLSYAEQMERSKGRAVSPLIISPDEKNPVIRKRGNMYILRWTAGTWVVTNAGGSFVENHSENQIGLPAEKVTMMLDGEPFDFDHIPDIPASAIRKMERHHKGDGYGTVNLITSAVEVPDSVPGNVNPELSILITGVVPEGSYWRTSIYQKSGRNDSFDWHTYASYTTWTDRAENVRLHLRDVVCRPDHHVYVNVTRQGERHLQRLKDIMKECGVEHYTIRHENEM